MHSLHAFMQAEIYALQQKLGDSEEEDDAGEEEEEEEEEEEGEEEEEEEAEDGDEFEVRSDAMAVISASTRRTRRVAILDVKAERKRMSVVMMANGMNKAELAQVAVFRI
jgi:CO dehydrogenase/acetyl-CoA synthase beta subunit